MKIKFSRQIFEKNTQISHFMKIRPLLTEFVPCGQNGERTDMMEQIVAFGNFENAPKNKFEEISL